MGGIRERNEIGDKYMFPIGRKVQEKLKEKVKDPAGWISGLEVKKERATMAW